MSSIVTKRLITTEDYYKMAETGVLKPDEKVELIHGEIFNMSPIGSKHASVVDQLSDLFRNFRDMKTIVRTQGPIYIDQWNEPEPDITLMKYRSDRYFTAHPVPDDILLIVEVSDTSYDFDRKVKLPLYASAGIPACWIIHMSENSIEEYEDPVEDRYQKKTLYVPGERISFLDKSFDVSALLRA